MHKAPLNFLIPVHLRQTLQEEQRLPDDQKLVLDQATPWLMRFGAGRENFILQQVYTMPGTILVLLSVHVKGHTKLQVVCPDCFTCFQYTLQGFAFARLNGHGCLPLFENTYTLQYVSEGVHEVLFAPGRYHYLYIVPGPIIETLAANEPGAALLSGMAAAGAMEGRLGLRLPIRTSEKKLLDKLLHMAPGTAHIEFLITGVLLALLQAYSGQVLQKTVPPIPADHHAFMIAFVANRIHVPVADLIQELKTRLFMETPTLRNIWLQNMGASPRQSFKVLRLMKGLYHLTLEGLTVNETAGILNFQDVTAFSKQFRRHFKLPPSQASMLFYT